MPNTQKIRELNDAFRKSLVGGRLVATASVAQRDDFQTILKTVREYTSFDPGDDPWGEHDFGAFKVADEQLFFKIDYYDADLNGGSPDPSDPTVTTRILTIMLGSEY